MRCQKQKLPELSMKMFAALMSLCQIRLLCISVIAAFNGMSRFSTNASVNGSLKLSRAALIMGIIMPTPAFTTEATVSVTSKSLGTSSSKV